MLIKKSASFLLGLLYVWSRSEFESTEQWGPCKCSLTTVYYIIIFFSIIYMSILAYHLAFSLKLTRYILNHPIIILQYSSHTHTFVSFPPFQIINFIEPRTTYLHFYTKFYLGVISFRFPIWVYKANITFDRKYTLTPFLSFTSLVKCFHIP